MIRSTWGSLEDAVEGSKKLHGRQLRPRGRTVERRLGTLKGI
jgi:hypothetical protein